MNKEDFLDHPELIEEAQKLNSISMNPSRSTTGAANWTNPRTGTVYTVTSGGELSLAKKIRDTHKAVFGVLDIAEKVSATGGTRPTAPAPGDCFFDTAAGKPIWYNGTKWVDATGTNI